MNMEQENNVEPIWGGYETASRFSGLGRTTLWKLRKSNSIISAKEGSRVVINLPSLDRYLHDLAYKGSSELFDNNISDEKRSGA